MRECLCQDSASPSLSTDSAHAVLLDVTASYISKVAPCTRWLSFHKVLRKGVRSPIIITIIIIITLIVIVVDNDTSANITTAKPFVWDHRFDCWMIFSVFAAGAPFDNCLPCFVLFWDGQNLLKHFFLCLARNIAWKNDPNFPSSMSNLLTVDFKWNWRW